MLDPELAGLLWLLRERELPLVIAGPAGSGRADLARALEPSNLTNSGDTLPEETLILAADSLEGVFDRLSAPPLSLLPDQVRARSLVLILRSVQGLGTRLAAAYYLRPVERDAGGHLQRRPPALLSAWDPDLDRHEHFAWALTTELADRLGMPLAKLEHDHHHRSDVLRELVAADRLEQTDLLSAIARHRPS